MINVKSVQKEMRKLKIPYIGYNYLAELKNLGQLSERDKKIARIQIEQPKQVNG